MPWTGWGGREGERSVEMARKIWLLFGGRWDIYTCVFVRWCVALLKCTCAFTHTRSYAHKQLASSSLVLVSCPWPWRAQESAVSFWRIDTGTPHPSASTPTLPNIYLHPSVLPALYCSPPPLPLQQPAHAWWACLRRDVLKSGDKATYWPWLYWNMPNCHSESASRLASYFSRVSH